MSSRNCPHPAECDADRICIYRCQWDAEGRYIGNSPFVAAVDKTMTKITDLAERRRMRGLDEPPSFHPSGIHIEVTLTPAPESLAKTGLLIAPTADKPIGYVHDFAPATYSGLLEMPERAPLEPDDIPSQVHRISREQVELLLAALVFWCFGVVSGFCLRGWL